MNFFYNSHQLPSAIQSTSQDQIQQIKATPSLKHMISQIEKLFVILSNSPKSRLIVSSGPNGVGKTNFVYKLLQPFLYNQRFIKEQKVLKLAPYLLKGNDPDRIIKKLDLLEKQVTGGILIVSDLYLDWKYLPYVIRMMERILETANSTKTFVVISGFPGQIKALTNISSIKPFFDPQLHIVFKDPDLDQLVSIFEDYLLDRGIGISNNGKKAVKSYLFFLRKLKSMRRRLHKDGIRSYPSKQRNFNNASEINELMNSIIRSYPYIDFIEKDDVSTSMIYKHVKNEITELLNILSHRQAQNN